MSWTAQYSRLDRLLHGAAFASVGLQKVVADIEDTVFASQVRRVECERPIFVTSLPRAGTTLLLDLLARLPTTATHTYRNMPFLFCPLFWDRLSRPFRRDGETRQRAHGDGVSIDHDSPEAFEEAIWHAWWPSKYHDGRIDLWTARDEDEEFETFLSNHMRKVVALWQHNTFGRARRYLSKNNANVARLPLLARLFPDCRIVIPVREPRAHVASLHGQHLRFLQVHDEDSFARIYMRDIGHFDFGANLAPIAFPGFTADAQAARQPSFWLNYWIAAYRSIADVELPQVVFVSYEAMCSRPYQVLAGLLTRIDDATDVDVQELAMSVHEPRSGENVVSELDGARLAEAEAIYQRLSEKSVGLAPARMSNGSAPCRDVAS